MTIPSDGFQVLDRELLLLETVRSQFELDPETALGIARTLRALLRIYQELITGGDPEIHAGRLVLLGLVNHTHQLLLGGLRGLSDGNGGVWALCTRGLMETFGAGVFISEHPNKAPTFLESGISAGKLRAAAERGDPGLAGDISRLNRVAHPDSGAIYAGIHAIDSTRRMAGLKYGLLVPPPNEAREGLTVLGNLGRLIAERFGTLAQNEAIVSAGKIVMVRQPGFRML